MGKFKLDDYNVDYVIPELEEDALKFLNLSGRQAYKSQGIEGQGIVVAILDSGVSPHPEFEDRLLDGKNFCKYRSSKDTTDDLGHGTHVAGSVAGKNVGIARKAEILPVKVLDGAGGGDFRDIIAGLRWVRDWRHPRTGQKVNIVSMSLSTDTRMSTMDEIRELEQAINELVAEDIAVFCSAGNTGIVQDRFPAAFDAVICVGAVDINKQLAMFSTKGDHVDICQIGVDVISAWHKGGYAVMSGTSMSTPLSAGIGALIACKYEQAFEERITEDYLWKTVKFNTKDLGIPGADKEYGVGFCTVQPLQANVWMQYNNTTMVVNGNNIEMDVAPTILPPGRFVVPARFLSEIFGTYIKFDPENQAAKFIS